METRNFIAGEWCKGEDSIENRNPSDLTDVIGHFAQGSAADLDRAIAAARGAPRAWARRPAVERAQYLRRVAARIRERAVLAGVPLHSDPPTARAIHAAVEIGQPIRPEHYKPVAAAIRFAEALRKRKR